MLGLFTLGELLLDLLPAVGDLADEVARVDLDIRPDLLELEDDLVAIGLDKLELIGVKRLLVEPYFCLGEVLLVFAKLRQDLQLDYLRILFQDSEAVPCFGLVWARSKQEREGAILDIVSLNRLWGELEDLDLLQGNSEMPDFLSREDEGFFADDVQTRLVGVKKPGAPFSNFFVPKDFVDRGTRKDGIHRLDGTRPLRPFAEKCIDAIIQDSAVGVAGPRDEKTSGNECRSDDEAGRGGKHPISSYVRSQWWLTVASSRSFGPNGGTDHARKPLRL